MELKDLTLKGKKLKNNIFIAPMAGYTDYAFRNLMLKFGAGLTFTELVSAKGIVYGSKGNNTILYSGEDNKDTAVQIFGSEPYFMLKAIESKELEKFDIVDINMGCPVPKIYKNGEGSALLNDIHLAERIVKECEKSGKIITVKIRTGQKVGDDIAREYALMAENSGASLITIHGRVRERYYSGEVDYEAIRKAKDSVKIPVIANGGIFSEADADLMIERTGADGVMLARGAISNPFLVSKLTNTETEIRLKEFMIEHLNLRRIIYDDKRSAVEFRKFIPYYFKNRPFSKELKMKLFSANTTDEIISILEENL